jgi:serine/threonine protein phosphatase PrpC
MVAKVLTPDLTDPIQPVLGTITVEGEDLVGLVTKALRRGKIIATTNPERAAFRKRVFVRQRDKDHDVNQVWVVSTAAQRSDPGYSDLQMTRSICDWRAADMVLPNAQIHTFEVPAGKVFRVCLASDGLWDVCTFARAAAIIGKSKSVHTAALEMMAIPVGEYIGVRGHDMMDDDTTILVVELNPSGIKVASPSGDGCCSMM